MKAKWLIDYYEIARGESQIIIILIIINIILVFWCFIGQNSRKYFLSSLDIFPPFGPNFSPHFAMCARMFICTKYEQELRKRFCRCGFLYKSHRLARVKKVRWANKVDWNSGQDQDCNMWTHNRETQNLRIVLECPSIWSTWMFV